MLARIESSDHTNRFAQPFNLAAFGRNRSYDRNTTDGKAIPRMKEFLFCLHPWDGFAIRGNYLRAARRSH
ncbi:MAG: hypothetical protein QGF00_36940, partial [Planctomycetota bacterium]|nr:hypothetical protein [Planctomycetota bacterium]